MKIEKITNIRFTKEEIANLIFEKIKESGGPITPDNWSWLFSSSEDYFLVSIVENQTEIGK